jgi:K+-sensing histidine kinase KdpD
MKSSDVIRLLSHDFRAPERRMVQLTKLLADDLGPDVAADHADLLDMVQAEGVRLSAMVEWLGRLHRIEQHAADTAVCDLETVLQQAHRRAADGPARGSSLEVTGPSGSVAGGAGLLEAVFVELFSNACQAAGADGPTHIQVELAHDERVWAITVTDNGPGLPSDGHEVAFDLFVRLSPSGDHGRVGAGLTFCREALSALGGSIVWAPLPDGGGRMELSLPVL